MTDQRSAASLVAVRLLGWARAWERRMHTHPRDPVPEMSRKILKTQLLKAQALMGESDLDDTINTLCQTRATNGTDTFTMVLYVCDAAELVRDIETALCNHYALNPEDPNPY